MQATIFSPPSALPIKTFKPSHTAAPQVQRFIHCARVQARDVLELWLIPLLAVFLPWRLCFAFYRRLAGWSWLFRKKIDDDLSMALRYHLIRPEDAAAFARERRLVNLMDIADCFISYTRPVSWLRHHARIDGQWPDPNQAAIIFAFHWGTGPWLLRHAHLAGSPLHVMGNAHIRREQFRGRPLLYWSGIMRLHHPYHSLKHPVIDNQNELRSIVTNIQSGQHILLLPDVPADEFQAKALQTTLFDYSVDLPAGMFHFAVRHQLPCAIAFCALNTETGQREMTLRHLDKASTAEELCHDVMRYLDQANRVHPAQWHFYNIFPRFLHAPASQNASPQN